MRTVTVMRGSTAWKPKAAAAGDSPSTITMVPRFTRASQSAAGAPGGSTTTSGVLDSTSPMEASASLHAPRSGATIWKESVAAGSGPPMLIRHKRLVTERIPDSDSEIVVVGAVGIGLIFHVNAAQEIHRKLSLLEAPADTRPGFRRV